MAKDGPLAACAAYMPLPSKHSRRNGKLYLEHEPGAGICVVLGNPTRNERM